MDGGGCLDQPLTRSGPQRGPEAEGVESPFRAPLRRERVGRRHRRVRFDLGRLRDRLGRLRLRAWGAAYQQWIGRLARRPAPPRGVGMAGAAVFLGLALAYGAAVGGHMPVVIDWLKDARDQAANAAGFRIAAVSLTGQREVSRDQVLAMAGVTGHVSLLFLDAEAARARLMANPWIADAAVLKLYPDRLQISVTERQAFALWQKEGSVSVIAADGTVLQPLTENRYRALPLLVGKGAERAGHDFLAILDRYPDLRALLRASIFVAERRWNLRLSNGLDVRLPEVGVEQALDRLVALDRDRKLLSRDITSVDLRLPDRVIVRLSDAAAQAREEALKDKDKKKKKGGDA
jgi:cell division protein FtsQ